MFNSKMFENSRPDGVSALEICLEIGDPTVNERIGKQIELRRFVPLKRSELTGEVTGPLAALHLTQTFSYSRAEYDGVIEAVYRFPLPGDAAVTGVSVRFGDVEITAELKARETAEEDYEEAVRQGRQAALATRESPDVFTLHVAGLKPDEEVTILTDYVQLAKSDGLDWTIRIPLTTSPRYVRADEANSRHAQGQPLLSLRDPGHRFSLDLILRQCGAVTSPTHCLNVTDIQEDERRVQLTDGEVIPNRDCVLTWRPLQNKTVAGLNVILHHDKTSDYVYFLALVTPPAAGPNPDAPREVTLLVDHSGSMEGAKWQAADWAVTRFLNDLTPQDAFALGLFHSTTKWLHAKRPVMAEASAIKEAIRFLEQNRDSGGTELGVALEQALRFETLPGNHARHLLIVTDAEVSDAGRILRMIDAEAARTGHRHISVLCIDAAPNAYLANEMAERGGGIAKFLTSDPDQEDIATALDSVLEQFGRPVLVDLCLEVDRPKAQAAGRTVLAGTTPNTSTIDLGALPRGVALWIAGRVRRGDQNSLTFAITQHGRTATTLPLDLAAQTTQHPAVKALFGARRLLALENLMTAHYDQKEILEQLERLGYDAQRELTGAGALKPTIYAENARPDVQSQLRALLVREALEFGLASAETAFIARRLEKGEPVERSMTVANALPAGWSDTFLAEPWVDPAAGFMDFSVPPTGSMMRMRSMSSPAPTPPSIPAQSAPPASNSGSGIVSKALGFLGLGGNSRPAFQYSVRDSVGSVGSGTYDHSVQKTGHTPLFLGIPIFIGCEATLFDSTRAADTSRLASGITLKRLTIAFPTSAPDQSAIGSDVAILIYVDDLTTPRARVRLIDLLRQGGTRPLNIRHDGAQPVRIVLVDPHGVLNGSISQMELTLDW